MRKTTLKCFVLQDVIQGTDTTHPQCSVICVQQTPTIGRPIEQLALRVLLERIQKNRLVKLTILAVCNVSLAIIINNNSILK